MRFQPGMVGVITGAGSGFGREMSLNLAKKGVNLGLSDVDMAGLEATAGLCREAATAAGFPNWKVVTVRCDVSKCQEVFDFAAAVRGRLAEDGRVDFVAANAGICALSDNWSEEPMETAEKVVQINVLGVMYTAKAFLPMLRAQTRGSCLLLLCSQAGIMGAAPMTTYCASKFGVRGFGESLMREMKNSSPHVLVTLVHPGLCSTNIFAAMPLSTSATSDTTWTAKRIAEGSATRTEAVDFLASYASHTAQSAVECMVRGVERGATRLLLTPEAHIWDFAVRVAPRLVFTTVGGTLVDLIALVARGIAPLTMLMTPGLPSPGVDRTVFAATALGAAALFRRSRL